jgi:hypothetical protein
VHVCRTWLESNTPGAWYTQEELDHIEAEGNLEASDPKMSRVTEDLIDLLVSKGVFEITELPQVAQDKLAERDLWRTQL